MVNKKNIKVGDYVRWLYPLGYIDFQERRYAQGIITKLKGKDDRIDGLTICILDSSYNQFFWLSLDLLIDLGHMQVLDDGEWKTIKRI